MIGTIYLDLLHHEAAVIKPCQRILKHLPPALFDSLTTLNIRTNSRRNSSKRLLYV